MTTGQESTADRDPDGDGLISRVFSKATGAVVDIVDPDAIIDQVDVNALMDRVDVNALLDRVDPQVILDNVDVNALMDRVDVDALLDRVDPQVILDTVDVNALMSRVDIEALLDRVDIKELTDRAGISDIVRESTGALAGSAIDIFRRQIVAVDQVVERATYRFLRRDVATRPVAPPTLKVELGVDEGGRGQVTGHFAGPISRLLAYMLDTLIVWATFVGLIWSAAFVVEFLFGIQVATSWEGGAAGAFLITVWAFFYHWGSLAVAGKTFGMATLGIRVTSRDGAPLSAKHAAFRQLVFPISLMFFGLGLLGIFTSPERRTLHDAAGGSVVVYDWGDRPAEMPAPITRWLDSHGENYE